MSNVRPFPRRKLQLSEPIALACGGCGSLVFGLVGEHARSTGGAIVCVECGEIAMNIGWTESPPDVPTAA